RASVEVVSQVSPADLARPTPCAGWTLGDLLAHMTVQHDGFAAAAAGHGADLARWHTGAPADHPVPEDAAAGARGLDAVPRPGVEDREFALPELSTDRTFPGQQAIGFHLVDYVVHGWDVAASLGLPYELEPGLLGAALDITRGVPDGENRLRPGAV